MKHQEQTPDQRLLGSAERADAEGVKAALAEGADPNAKNKDGFNALRLSIAHNDEKTFTTLLTLENIDIEAKRFTETALFDALKARNAPMTYALLDKGADVNVVNQFGETPLHLAAEWNDIEITKAMLAKGADATRVDVRGKSAHTLAYAKGYTELGDILKSAQQDQQSLPLSQSALNQHFRAAAARGDISSAARLLANHAEINSSDEYSFGRTALHLAANGGHTAMVQFLLASNADIEAKDIEQRTALHMAALNGKDSTVDALLVANASAVATDKYGMTPAGLAYSKGHNELGDRLKSAHDKQMQTRPWAKTITNLRQKAEEVAVTER